MWCDNSHATSTITKARPRTHSSANHCHCFANNNKRNERNDHTASTKNCSAPTSQPTNITASARPPAAPTTRTCFSTTISKQHQQQQAPTIPEHHDHGMLSTHANVTTVSTLAPHDNLPLPRTSFNTTKCSVLLWAV